MANNSIPTDEEYAELKRTLTAKLNVAVKPRPRRRFSAQQITLLVGVLLLALAGLFPPYTLVARRYAATSERSLGYYFIGTPPPAPLPDTTGPVRLRAGYSVEIDTTRLFIQWGVILLLTAGVWLALRGTHSHKTP